MICRLLLGISVALSLLGPGVVTRCAAAQICPALPPPLQPSVQRVLSSKPGDLFVVLKNGLTLLMSQKPNYDVVSAQVFVRAGSIYEGKYLKSGLSHYLEHVVSGGTTRSFTEDQGKERLKKIGGNSNAYTSHDRTVYYINTSAEHWKDALDLLLSYVSECTLEPSEVAREKPVIQQEIKMGESNPGNELWKLFLRTAYQVSPVRNPVIGYEEVFVRLDRQALLDYYAQRYQPENIVVVVAGNISPQAVLSFVVDKTKDFLGTAGEFDAVPVEPAQSTTRRQEKEIPVARLTQAMVGFPSVDLNHQDMYALDVLSLLLGGGETCRLHCRLKDMENKVLSVSASNWTPSYTKGQFIVSFTLPPDEWPGVLSQLGEEIEVFKRDLVPMKELDKAKKTAMASHVFSNETVSSIAASLGSSYFGTGDPYYDDTYVEEIRRLTPEDIRSAAQRYLLMDRINVAATKPLSRQAAPTPDTTTCPPREASPAHMSKLDNGLKVLLKRDDSLPMVTMHLYGLGGLMLEDGDKPGIASLTSALMTSGTLTRTRQQILQSIEDVGGSIETQSENSTYHVSIKVLKEDFHTALDILADIVRNAQYPEEEIEKKRQDTLLAIQRMDESWQAEIVRLFKKNYFRKSPYRNDRLGTRESVESISRDDLLRFHRRTVNPGQAVLAVYGDIDAEKTSERIRQLFGTWEHGEVKHPELPEETKQISSNRVVEKKNEKGSAALFVGTNGFAIRNSRRATLDVLDAVLSGAGNPGGRIFEALRGKQDLVYVVGAFPFYGNNAGYFGVITQTTMANLDKVQGIILDNLRLLAKEPVPADELEKAKTQIVTAHRLHMESLDAQAESAAINEVLGLGWQYDKEYLKEVQAVGPADIRNLAKELFTHTLIARTIPERPVEVLSVPPPSKSDVRAQ
ncbi:MAG TPA: pitrilysin family protein [Syntrophobacter fumaroxidans]|nr:pitrilysin family protein [Syntrophobacter fumaroxidans]